MKDFSRFLVGIDERGLADHAAHAAMDLATCVGASTEVLHAVPVSAPDWMGIEKGRLAHLHGSALERAQEETLERLAGVEAHLGLAPQRLSSHLRVTGGKAHDCLLHRAREWEADVIFLGTHERHGIVDFGGTARRILHGTACSLWYQPIPYTRPERILVSVDLEEGSREVLSTARDLAAALRVPVRILHCFYAPAPYIATGMKSGFDWNAEVVEPAAATTRARLDEILAKIDWKGVAYEVEITTDAHAERGILDRQGADQLLILGTRHHTALGGLLLGSVAYHVLRRAECPVLVLHPGDSTGS